MDTKALNTSVEDLQYAAELIKGGSLVAIPTETVYGLGANGLDPVAVEKIFTVKGRPQDNPLILHLSSAADMELYCDSIPPKAYDLAAAFWPGPLTMILKRRDIVPPVISAGLDTVAVRCPENDAARTIIKLAGVPIAAPSANISGKPSPTRARHVIEDLGGRIEAVVDGGDCVVGVESTIIDLSAEPPRLLRPGGLSKERIEAVIGHIEAPGGFEPERPIAPGMKYRHYAPKARITLVVGDAARAAEYINSQPCGECAVLCPDEEKAFYTAGCIVYGSLSDPETMAHGLFSALRELDEKGYKSAYARCPGSGGILAAVQNRLVKAAAVIIEV